MGGPLEVSFLVLGVSVSAIFPREQAGHGQRRWMGSDASLFFLHCAEVEAVSEPWEDTCGAEIYRGEMKARFLFLLQGMRVVLDSDSDDRVMTLHAVGAATLWLGGAANCGPPRGPVRSARRPPGPALGVPPTSCRS